MFAHTTFSDLRVSAAMDLLFADDNLWSAVVMPENMTLLASLWSRLDESQHRALIGAVLNGPDRPRDTPEERERVDHAIWLVLSRRASVGTPELTSDAMSQLTRLEHDYGWRRSADNREDFAVRSEMRWGLETDLSAEQMLTMPVEELVERLIEPDHVA
jgi:hypothetical protein